MWIIAVIMLMLNLMYVTKCFIDAILTFRLGFNVTKGTELMGVMLCFAIEKISLWKRGLTVCSGVAGVNAAQERIYVVVD